MRKLICLVGSLSLIACPAWAARQIITPSGQPDAVFVGVSQEQASSKIVNTCLDSGMQVTSQSPTQVVCEAKVGVFTAALQQLLVGNQYSTTPRTFIRVTLVPTGDRIRAQATAWVETTMAFGQVRQEPLSGDRPADELENLLFKAGARAPDGTRYRGPYLGIELAPDAVGKGASATVVKVFRIGPGHDAGLQAGDRILKINNQGVRDGSELRRRLGQLTVGATYPILLERNGAQMTVVAVAAERPIAGSPDDLALREEVAAARPQPAAASSPTAAAAPTPQAAATPEVQQIEALAKLKAEGLLTDEEFTAKKRLILGIGESK